MRHLLATAATLLFVTPCLAQQLHLPPVEYDRPYNGKLTVETLTNAQLRAQCANANMSSLGCAFPGANSCRILLVDEASIRAVGWTVELMLRHERAHCNGWPQSHPGMRPYDAKPGSAPVLDVDGIIYPVWKVWPR